MISHARKAKRNLKRFIGDRSGASVIEAAFAFPVFIVMLIGVVEMAMLMFVQVAVEGGLREASRYGITGQAAPDGLTREQQIVKIIKGHAQDLVEIDASKVELLTYSDFSSVGQPEPYIDDNPADGPEYKPGLDEFVPGMHDRNGNGTWDADQGDASNGAGTSGAVVLYRVTFDWQWLTPFPPMVELAMETGMASGESDLPDSVTLQAAIAVRNEPWPE